MTQVSTRAILGLRPPAPVRLVHLGLGHFFRAHQAWFTDQAPDAEGWGIAAFGGRTSAVANALLAQECAYTVVTRAGDGDSFNLVSSISSAHASNDHAAWLAYFRSSALAAVTATITEAGYLYRADGTLDVDRADIAADAKALRADPTAQVVTAPARLVAGLNARRQADGGPIALIPCDNVAGNGPMLERVVLTMASMVDASLADWISSSVEVVSSVVDRITPASTADDRQDVYRATGFRDQCPVVTEPFSEWVLAGSFPAARPEWEVAGARFVDDVGPFEQRKLWLLNGAHSLLAYTGPILGHQTVAEAMLDPQCRLWLGDWWDEACGQLDQAELDLDSYRAALVDRFSNQRIAHRLAQIAVDGSQKLRVRVVPVLRAERAVGHLSVGSTRLLGAWLLHLRGAGVPVVDAAAGTVVPLAGGPLAEAARQVLNWLDPAVGEDDEVVAAVVDQARRLQA